MLVEGRHGERCRRRCHPVGRRHGHDPSPDEAGYRRSGEGRGERSPFAAPAQRSGLLRDQGLVLCSAARPPGGDRAGLLSRPDEPDRGASDEHQRIVLDLPPGSISGGRPARARRRGPTRSAHGLTACSGCGVTPHRPRPARRPPPSRSSTTCLGSASSCWPPSGISPSGWCRRPLRRPVRAQSTGKSTNKKATS